MTHISASEKREGLPEMGNATHCGRQDCPATEFETGFGLAGGGYGVYEYCDVCSQVVSKTVEADE